MLRWFPLCLLGCSDGQDKPSMEADATDDDPATCIETVVEIGLDDSIVGFGLVSDPVLALEVSGSTEGVYANGSTAMVFIETRFADGTISHVISEQNPSLSAEIDMGCVDRIEVVLDAELISSDDQLRVFRTMTGTAALDGTFGLSAMLDASDNTGSHDSDGGMYAVSASIIEGRSYGEVSVVNQGSEGDSAWIENEVLLTWPIPQ